MSQRRSDSSGAVAAVFGVLLLVGVVITYYWFFIAAGTAVGLFFAVRALIRREQERRLAAAREAEEIAYRAERQHRWAQRGDDRGVYGVEGAELMHSISPRLPLQPLGELAEDPEIAAIAYTATDLKRLIAQKPPAWRWAAFASVLVQRRAAVLTRLPDFDLRYVMPGGECAYGGRDVGCFVADSMHELSRLVEQLESFMTAPAFMGVFGGHNEDAADADGIQHVANRLMDLHERFGFTERRTLPSGRVDQGFIQAQDRLHQESVSCASARRQSTKTEWNSSSLSALKVSTAIQCNGLD